MRDSGTMAAEALAADAVASRLERQEEDIRWLWAEVQRLRDEQLSAPDRCRAEGPSLTREVAQLRAENRDLRQRLGRLRLSLAEELSRGAGLGSAAPGKAGRAAAGAQVTGAGLREGSRARRCACGGAQLCRPGCGGGGGCLAGPPPCRARHALLPARRPGSQPVSRTVSARCS